ncbi:alpha/beta fold hydrolase [Kitasatospora sp. NPDC101235]|uniref:alpha/beta fold hydrolase n=1 Tax=Kitasatospora sp. NPDC101235 TaxID=3364101 RepID=UPI003812CED5
MDETTTPPNEDSRARPDAAPNAPGRRRARTRRWRIALIDTGPRLDAYAGDSFAARLITTPVVAELVWRLRTDSTIRAALDSAFTRHVRIPDRIVSDVRGMTYRSLTATDEASSAYVRERPVPDRLAGLGLPTLVIFGSQDRRWQPASAQDYHRVPHARIEILDGVGHTPMFEDPDTTGALLHGFVDTATPPAEEAADLVRAGTGLFAPGHP